MNRKTINAIISKKMRQWWDTIEDADLRELVEKDTIVTGGAIVAMLLNEPVSDYDVYLQTADTVEKLAKYYAAKFNDRKKNQGNPAGGIPIPPITVIRIPGEEEPDRIQIIIKSAGIASEDGTSPYAYFEGRPPEEAQAYVHEVFNGAAEKAELEKIEDVYEETQEQALNTEDTAYRPVFLTTNAITLTNKVQVIIRFYGTPGEIHKNYDYVHCTNYWTEKDGVVLNQPALEAILNKDLKYIGSKYPICSIIRMRKFIQRGWKINAGQIVKMAFQISELDLNDLEVLKDQLTGVDVAYFIQVIDLLKAKSPDRVDSAYLIEIIDRMF